MLNIRVILFYDDITTGQAAADALGAVLQDDFRPYATGLVRKGQQGAASTIAQYGVTAFPTLVFCNDDPDGDKFTKVARLTGTPSQQEIKNVLDAIFANQETIDSAAFNSNAPGVDLYEFETDSAGNSSLSPFSGTGGGTGSSLFSGPGFALLLGTAFVAKKALNSDKLVHTAGYAGLTVLGGREILKRTSIFGYSLGSSIGATLKAHRFHPVYSILPGTNGRTNGKTNLGYTKNKRGVYIIKEDGKIVYVGYSGSNLYRTIIRHFQVWNDDRPQFQQSPRVSYAYKLNRYRYTIRVAFTNTAAQAYNLEKGLIRKYKPRDNFDKIKGEYEPKVEKKIDEITEYFKQAEYVEPPF